jgi:DNA-binding GntR family transcriptional regulator
MSDLDLLEDRYHSARIGEVRQAFADAFLDADRSFHRTLTDRTGNGRLIAVIEGLWAQIGVFQRAGARKGWTDVSIQHHRAIIAALRAKDVEAAVTAMKRHIGEVKRMVLADLAQQGSSSSDHVQLDDMVTVSATD